MIVKTDYLEANPWAVEPVFVGEKVYSEEHQTFASLWTDEVEELLVLKAVAVAVAEQVC